MLGEFSTVYHFLVLFSVFIFKNIFFSVSENVPNLFTIYHVKDIRIFRPVVLFWKKRHTSIYLCWFLDCLDHEGKHDLYYNNLTIPSSFIYFFYCNFLSLFTVCYKLNYPTYLHSTSVCSACYGNCFHRVIMIWSVFYVRVYFANFDGFF